MWGLLLTFEWYLKPLALTAVGILKRGGVTAAFRNLSHLSCIMITGDYGWHGRGPGLIAALQGNIGWDQGTPEHFWVGG